jgi:hypothetical protein
MASKAANNAPKRPSKTRLKATVAARQKAARKPTSSPTPAAAPPDSPAQTNKQGLLIARLSTATGATIAELSALTGWQAHTVRGTISGALRKRLGLRVLRDKPAGGESRYRIETAGRV